MGDTSGMSQPEWRVVLYVKRLIEALRKLMKSTLVDDDQAVDNALEIFKQACAEAIAQVTDYYMIHKVRLYAALIVDPTLSSASCYQCAEAHRCNSCPKCRLIKQSHISLYKDGYPWQNEIEHMLKIPPPNMPLGKTEQVVTASQLYRNQTKERPVRVHLR